MGPMIPNVRLDFCNSAMLRAYHPISGLVARRRMISAWYATAVKSDMSVSTG